MTTENSERLLQHLPDLIDIVLQTAAKWQTHANRLKTSEDKALQDQLSRLIAHPQDKALLVKLFDQSFRSSDPSRVANQINYLLASHGSPEFFSGPEKLLLALFRNIGRHLPGVSIPRIIAKLRTDSRHMIIPGESESLTAYLSKRKRQGVQVNINHLGEAVLGEQEARRRLQAYLDDLKNPLIEYISVKISSIYSQIHSLAFENCVDKISQRLAILYREAQNHAFVREDGTQAPKVVNLDMEAYGDLAITVEAFRRTLDQAEFKTYMAGIVLQAYLPESYTIQQTLTRWAQARVADGGSPIKIRLVKGANMEMEQIESALQGWPLAPYDNKLEVDANYKRMVLYGLHPDHCRAVRIGIASHNLFEMALAYQVAQRNSVEAYVVFEMLEGMADHVRRALAEQGLPLLLYAPVATEKEFPNAIAYLIRRLDENTGPNNFLRYAPLLETDSTSWQLLQDRFVASCRYIGRLIATTHRTQNRLDEDPSQPVGMEKRPTFTNEPDTDWSLAPNRKWAQDIRRRWQRALGHEPLRIPLVVGGRAIEDRDLKRDIIDPNQLPETICVARYALAQNEDVDQAIDVARRDPDGWRRLSADQRLSFLSRVAAGLRQARGELIGAMAANTGKVFSEADSEVSEAVDFATYYPMSAKDFERRKNLQLQGKGVGVVVSPWNFPLAIPCGGIVASLAAGNTVILKPSSDAVLVAWLLCQVFWQAGISQNTLQFLPCGGAETGARLTGHPEVDFVILTGGTATAMTMLGQRPDLFLAAETGGKNSTIVTATADRDQAISNVIHSAFGHCGQKCSATSLLILEREVFNDTHFKSALIDAAASLAVGPAWSLESRMGPLIRPPGGALRRAFKTLEPGESWALAPRNIRDNPQLWTPGIKWGVQPGSFTHMTELFGPVLGVMRAKDLTHALTLANQTGYGLTAGIESLDPREVKQWQEGMWAGNLYINRGTTGAITLRQPFGGMGKSAVGPAIKAGGPDYVTQFMQISEHATPEPGLIKKAHPLLALAQRWQRKSLEIQDSDLRAELDNCVWAINSYLHHAQTDFMPVRDYFHLRGQDNLHRNLPVKRMTVCLHAEDSLFEAVARIAAAQIAGCRTTLSLPADLANPVVDFLLGEEGRLLLYTVRVRRQTEEQVVQTVAQTDRLRYANAQRVPPRVYAAAAAAGIYIAWSPVLMDGRMELLHYFMGQTVCDAYHRHGNLGERGLARGGA